jgi:hypothetical protein
VTGIEELTLTEAAARYDISLPHLRRKISYGEVEARKVRVVGGRPEWRVTPAAMEAAGHHVRRVIDLDAKPPAPDPLRREVEKLRQELARERAQSADLNSRLGYALLTAGWLRGRLREAGINPGEVFGGNLDGSSSARR